MFFVVSASKGLDCYITVERWSGLVCLLLLLIALIELMSLWFLCFPNCSNWFDVLVVKPCVCCVSCICFNSSIPLLYFFCFITLFASVSSILCLLPYFLFFSASTIEYFIAFNASTIWYCLIYFNTLMIGFFNYFYISLFLHFMCLLDWRLELSR